MTEYCNLGDMIRGDKITLEAGFIPKSQDIKIGKHHSYRTYGETNARAWITKPFHYVKITPIK